MAVLTDFSLARYEDGILTISMAPPVAIGAWDIRFRVQKRFGGTSGLITKSITSGFNGSSGITITNSGQGQFNVAINSRDTSGLEYGNYAFSTERFESGSRTILSEGYLQLMPGVG